MPVKMPDEFSPENPRDWNPNHQLLKSPQAPHETIGVLRLQRAGYDAKESMKILKMKGTQFVKELKKGLDEETDAHDRGCLIVDGRIKKGAK